MRIYAHRYEDDYLSLLRERLTIGGPNGLAARAVKITVPREHDGVLYDRCCRIDFAGIAATTLFDFGRNYTSIGCADLMKDLFSNVAELNQDGIFAKLRILLVYPYSAYAFSRIQAESTPNRSSMEEPVYPRNLDTVESVDQRMFTQSHFVTSQANMLDQIQEWTDTFGWGQDSLNRATVRLAPTSPDLCLLFVNDTVFMDTYLLAKEVRAKKRCASLAPLVQVDRSEDGAAFSALDDHFRYLWDLDLSMFCQDATSYEKGVPGSLGRIKAPTMISFDSKAARIRLKNPALSDAQTTTWKGRMGRVLGRFCMEPAPSPGSESVFITCSWETVDGQATPNRYARELSKLLETDFGHSRTHPLLSVFIMQGAAGEFFTQQLYARLDESTLAVVLLTADIAGNDGISYSKPNVYHELGYLMKRLGPKRVAIVCENGVMVPSNVHDVIRIDLEPNKPLLAYSKIGEWIIRTAALGATVKGEFENWQSARLDAAVTNGDLPHKEAKKARERLREMLGLG